MFHVRSRICPATIISDAPFYCLRFMTSLPSKMPFPMLALWKQDTALNSYIFCLFLIGLPFTVFGTYVIYQLQVVGYLIGTDAQGQPCANYCLVPFGSHLVDLNSALLYLNAMGFGLGGASAVLISAYADFWSKLCVVGHDEGEEC